MRGTLTRVLVADPCQTACRRMRRAFEGTGFVVQTVSTGEELFHACDLDPPDFLILDVHLPDMDGFEACDRIRRESDDGKPTIIITTDAIDDMTRGYLGPMVEYVGGDYFIAKPCDGKLLVSLLEDLATGSLVTTTVGRRPSPTRVVWPTSRPRAMAVTH